MKFYRHSWAWLAATTLGLLAAPAARADLHDYVKQKDDSYSWRLKEKVEVPDGVMYDLQLVSQTWQGIRWEHSLQVYLPRNVKPGSKMLLWNQGGNPNPLTMLLAMDLARKSQAPVAFLFNIPNQPLFGDAQKPGLKEDALIAETFVRYLATKDESWPLLFPMVKSLVKAMDALQDFAMKEWGVRLEGFIVTGGSKRGWTTWLTAAADARVKAIAPLVIDTLNMGEQLPHQLKSYGKYSEMIGDYTRRGLVPMPDTPEARKLWFMVDPYHHRNKVTVPTMIINGANDPYWTVDSLNLYWDGLKQDKWVLYVPNAGHDLTQKLPDGKKDRDRAINTLVAFTRHIVKDNPMPKLEWTHDDADGRPRLTLTSNPAPRGVRLWIADAPTRDFRKMTWRQSTMTLRDGRAVGQVDVPREGFTAFFGEADYEIDGIRHQLSTQVRVLQAR